MNDTAPVEHQPNPAVLGLLVLGAIGTILGIILWVSGSNQLAKDQTANDFARALDPVAYNLDPSSPAISADQTLIGVGIGILILGVVLMVAFLVVVAVNPRRNAK